MLELWHGPTCAFKGYGIADSADFLTTAMKKLQLKEKIVILVATSGDTGKAALEGFKDVEGTEIMVFYPEDGVSDMQKRQMVTQEGSNVNVCAVKGNFDDCQSGVKKILPTRPSRKNWLPEICGSPVPIPSTGTARSADRLLCVLLCDTGTAGRIADGETLNVVVPTGNFGNILAAYYAKNKWACRSAS